MTKQSATIVNRNLFAAITLGVALSSSVMTAQAYSGENLAKDAKITLPEARAIALKTVPGKITEEELEQEDGGLRYSFDIFLAKATHEVGVNAQTGKVLENSIEGPNAE